MSEFRQLIVNYDKFKIVIKFKDDEEVKRAQRGLIMLTSKFNLCKGGKSWWDGMTSKQRAEIERDSDWLNDKITNAKLEHANGQKR